MPKANDNIQNSLGDMLEKPEGLTRVLLEFQKERKQSVV